MEQGGAEDFTGSSAGEDIPRLTAAADFSEMISGLDIWGNYNQYYLLEFPDHSYILAQIPQTEADAIAKGESITLPIGQKAGMADAPGAAALLWFVLAVGLTLAGEKIFRKKQSKI